MKNWMIKFRTIAIEIVVVSSNRLQILKRLGRIGLTEITNLSTIVGKM